MVVKPIKKDPRIVKTQRTLIDSLNALLKHNNFRHITVNDICGEAMISRATFYAHYRDKYDLLESLLAAIRQELTGNVDDYLQIEQSINKFMLDNFKIVVNVLESADEETSALIHKFLFSFIGSSCKKKGQDENSLNYIILSTFCSGGLYNLLMWQVKNKFPPQSQVINSYTCRLLKCIVEWDAQQRQI